MEGIYYFFPKQTSLQLSSECSTSLDDPKDTFGTAEAEFKVLVIGVDLVLIKRKFGSGLKCSLPDVRYHSEGLKGTLTECGL